MNLVNVKDVETTLALKISLMTKKSDVGRDIPERKTLLIGKSYSEQVMIVRTSNLMKAKRCKVLQVTSKAHMVIKIFQNSLLDAHDESKNNLASFKMRSVVR